MSDIPVNAASAQVHIDLPLAGLAPGEYILEIRATDASGDAKELIPLRVTS